MSTRSGISRTVASSVLLRVVGRHDDRDPFTVDHRMSLEGPSEQPLYIIPRLPEMTCWKRCRHERSEGSAVCSLLPKKQIPRAQTQALEMTTLGSVSVELRCYPILEVTGAILLLLI